MFKISKPFGRLDHLYLDVNGILHRCSKDESVLFKKFVQGKSMKQIMTAIVDYMDYLVKVVRPRKSLFIAIDGVAPRAKMTSQKKERYKKQKTDKSVDDFLKKILGNENDLLEFKSGTISPGTEFMTKLRAHIDFYIKKKFTDDPFWKKLTVVFSGGDVPGEGEHKILEYIRRMKQTKDFSMTESHCIYSNDADLIMLSLATHLPYVSILRESMQFNKANVNLVATRKSEKPPLEFLYVNLLREYIDMEYRAIQDELPAPYKLERIIDDWVLLCFFIGNDFLRKIYCLNIKKGNFDEIIEIFKKTFKQTRDYSMREGSINWENFFCLLKNISQMELKLIQGAKEELIDYSKEIRDTERQAMERLLNQEKEMEKQAELRLNELPGDPHLEVIELPEEEKSESKNEEILAEDLNLIISGFLQKSEPTGPNSEASPANNISQLEPLSVEALEKPNVEDISASLNESEAFDEFSKSIASESGLPEPPKKGLSTKFKTEVVENEKNFVEMIERLYYEGKQHEAKRAYYKRFFGFDISEEEGQSKLRTVIKNYLEGIQFVITYYYDGCPSWTWYNKYALSPFLSDVVEFLENFGQEIRKDYEFEFEYSAPAEPFLQLLLILSPESSTLLPPEFRGIMKNPDSPAIQFYPTEFEMTPLDTKLDYAWLPLLPPVNDKIIENEYKRIKDQVWGTLDPEIKMRNNLGTPFKYKYSFSARLQVKMNESGLLIDEFPDFLAPVDIQPFDYMTSLFFDKKTSKHEVPKAMRQNQHFPSFEKFGLKFSPKLIQKRTRAGVPYHMMILEGFDQETLVADIIEKQENKDDNFFYGYPLQEPGFVGYIITERGFLNYSNFRPDYRDPLFQNDSYPWIFDKLCRNVKRQYLIDFGIDLGHIKELVIMEYIKGCYRSHARENKPYLSCNVNWSLYIPGCFISDKMITYQQIKYPDKCEVLWNQEQDTVLSVQSGSICRVLRNGAVLRNRIEIEFNRSQNSIQSKIDSRIMNQSAKYHKVDRQLLSKMGIIPKYYGVLWLLLESFIVQTDTSRDSYFILGQGFNMGLRAMDVFQIAPKFMAVPDLVKIILPKNLRGKNSDSLKSVYKYQIFKRAFKDKPAGYYEFDVRLSDQTVNLITNYVNPKNPKEHPYNSVLMKYLYARYYDFFDSNHTLTKIPMLKVTDIFKSESKEDPNMKLMDIYLWAISQEESNFPLMNSLSIVANRNIIHKIEEYVKFPGNQKSSRVKEWVDEASIVKLNKSRHLAMAPLSTHPPIHLPGDRVICVNYQYPAFVPFGMQATVVGIYKTEVEIVTDCPVIGGTSLGGRCSNFHGFTVSFEDIFNFKWRHLLMQKKEAFWCPWLGDLDLFLIKKEQGREILFADKRAQDEKIQRQKEKESSGYVRGSQGSKPQPKLMPKENFRRGFDYPTPEEANEPGDFYQKKLDTQWVPGPPIPVSGEEMKDSGNRNNETELEKSTTRVEFIEKSQGDCNSETLPQSDQEKRTWNILEAISSQEINRANEKKKPSLLDKVKGKK